MSVATEATTPWRGPTPMRTPTHPIRVEEPLWRAAVQKAQQEGTSVSDLVRGWLAGYVDPAQLRELEEAWEARERPGRSLRKGEGLELGPEVWRKAREVKISSSLGAWAKEFRGQWLPILRRGGDSLTLDCGQDRMVKVSKGAVTALH